MLLPTPPKNERTDSERVNGSLGSGEPSCQTDSFSKADEPVKDITLGALRKMEKITQMAMAKKLGITQANVSRLEARGDMLLSTLLGFVGAAAGEVEILVRIRHDVFALKLEESRGSKRAKKSSVDDGIEIGLLK